MGAFSVRVRDIYFGIITLVFGLFFIIAILLASRGIVGSIIEVWRVQPQTESEE